MHVMNAFHPPDFFGGVAAKITRVSKTVSIGCVLGGGVNPHRRFREAGGVSAGMQVQHYYVQHIAS